MPSVTVFIVPFDAPSADPAARARTIASLRSQEFDDWEGVLIGGPAVESARLKHVDDPDGWHEAVNQEIAASTADFVMVLPIGSTLRPGALASLVAEARTGNADAVYGGVRFVGAMGEAPVDITSDLPPVLGNRQWEQRKCVPLAGQLFKREAAAAHGIDGSMEDAADWDWCVRMARGSIKWRRAEAVVADVPLRAVPEAAGVLESIWRHSRVASAVTVGGGDGAGTAPEPSRLSEAGNGISSLMEHMASDNAWMSAGMEMPWLMGQWWHRFGFAGAAPLHVLPGHAPKAPVKLDALQQRPTVDVFVASYKRPDRLAAMIASVHATGYPVRVLVAAGDPESIEVCERFPDFVECVYSTAANRRTGCTAPLNHVASLLRHDAIFCTDDCVFAPDSIETAVRSLYTAYPDGDGVVGLAQENIPDGYALAFPLIGAKFRERFTRGGRELFFPGYFHMYNDAELGLTVQCLGRWHFEARAKLRHFHPCTGVAEDATHTRGRTFGDLDRHLWHQRRSAGTLWGIDSPESP